MNIWSIFCSHITTEASTIFFFIGQMATCCITGIPCTHSLMTPQETAAALDGCADNGLELSKGFRPFTNTLQTQSFPLARHKIPPTLESMVVMEILNQRIFFGSKNLRLLVKGLMISWEHSWYLTLDWQCSIITKQSMRPILLEHAHIGPRNTMSERRSLRSAIFGAWVVLC